MPEKKKKTPAINKPKLTRLQRARKETREFLLWSRHVLTFVIFLMAYLFMKFISWFGNSRFCPNFIWRRFKWPLEQGYLKLLNINRHNDRTINQYNLIELAIRSMAYKKVRTAITVGGMSVGIAAIVFLVSVGFGLQRLVVSRVARLDEMRQTDVSLQPGSQIKITDQSIASFSNLENVDLALPLISMVARVSYSGSSSDMVVYGVTTDYLEQSAIKPVRGDIFESRELAQTITNPQVAGVQDSSEPGHANRIRDVELKLEKDEWIKVRQTPEKNGKVIGYTRYDFDHIYAAEVWGDPYIDNEFGQAYEVEDGVWLGEWIHAQIPLWESTGCSIQVLSNCEDGYEPKVDDVGRQVNTQGYFAKIGVEIVGESDRPVQIKATNQVLGETDEASAAAALLEWIEIATQSAVASTDVTTVDIDGSAQKEAVVNRSMLKLLSLDESQAVGETFNVEYVVTGDLLPDSGEQIVSAPISYQIVGVTPEESAPFFYVPFADLRSLGIVNYSQVKIVAASQETLAKIRQQVEAMGFSSVSVVDTVAQIDRLFATARSILALVGFVALAVASLGMFNTLTVSLLERTHEVGLMKALGMRSHEVQELFLTESMIMGFFGGLLGAAIGIGAGKMVGVFLSAIGLVKGVGFIDVSYTPPSFLAGIFLLSMIVGLITGIFPARRAMKISALDALRYE